MNKNNKAIICGGCFWGIEENFRTKPGIISTEVGYTGGKTDSPTYESVCSGKTGHAECVQLIFDKNIISYEKIHKQDILDMKKYQISIYNNLLNSNKYPNNIKINSFEQKILKEINEKLNQNGLFLISENNWIMIFDKNNLSIGEIKLLEDYNKNSLENNNKIYTIYSKNILKKEENNIIKSNYKKIFSIQSKNLTFVSNSLISDSEIDLISKEFYNLKGDSDAQYFLNKKINLKNPHSIKPKNISYLKKINYFFDNIINVTILEFKAIIKQSIPETIPIYYAETNLKIF